MTPSTYRCQHCGRTIRHFSKLRLLGFAGGRYGGNRRWFVVEVRACPQCEGAMAREVCLPLVDHDDSTDENPMNERRAYAGVDHGAIDYPDRKKEG